ncbi:hypothetical protein [Streptomyces luteireticuli]|uniref:hypothetical protein n=1 Tax=Streptomyces luteireticuli TaxID=173858 RepID=UPI0035591E5B
MVQAVSLVLEGAEGIPPSAVDEAGQRTVTGFCVRAADEPGRIRVYWLGPRGSGTAREEGERLAACAEALRRAGWDSLLYRGPRGLRFLEVEPVRPSG